MSTPDTMLFWLSRAARGAREAADRRQVQVAASGPVDQSTVTRFERGVAWPSNPDRMIASYADDLDIDAIDLWTEALRLWRAHLDEEDGGVRETLTQLADAPSDQGAAGQARQP